MKRDKFERHVAELLEFTCIQYKHAGPEIKVLYDECFELADDEYSIFDEVLLYAEVIEGIAYKYTTHKAKESETKIKKLREINLYDSDSFISWFSKNAQRYREYTLYILALESLRTILIDDLEEVISEMAK